MQKNVEGTGRHIHGLGIVRLPRVVVLVMALAIAGGIPMAIPGPASAQQPVNTDGCSSSEVSWLCCEDEPVAVFCVVDAFVFPAEVEAPVGVEVAVGDQGAELEDGLGAFEAPSRARYVHSVLY
jgi:hypothetical protein